MSVSHDPKGQSASWVLVTSPDNRGLVSGQQSNIEIENVAQLFNTSARHVVTNFVGSIENEADQSLVQSFSSQNEVGGHVVAEVQYTDSASEDVPSECPDGSPGRQYVNSSATITGMYANFLHLSKEGPEDKNDEGISKENKIEETKNSQTASPKRLQGEGPIEEVAVKASLGATSNTVSVMIDTCSSSKLMIESAKKDNKFNQPGSASHVKTPVVITKGSFTNVAKNIIFSPSNNPLLPGPSNSTGNTLFKNTGDKDFSQEADKSLKCDECDYSSSNKHYLKQHMYHTHNTDRPYKCPFCDYAGKRSHALREHLIVHSNERPYECPHCNATFRKKGHLTNHTKLHQKTIVCPICRKVVLQSELESHINEEQHNKVFVCEVCNLVVKDEQKIIEHVNSHQKQQVLVCSTCKFMTKDFSEFVSHAESHQNSEVLNKEAKDPPPYVLIPKSNTNSTTTTQNAKTQEPQALVKCSECGFVSASRETMKEHMWRHIDKEENDVSSQNDGQSSASSPTDNAPDKKVMYKCIECEYVTGEPYHFVVHMLSHRPDLQQTSQAQQRQKLIEASAAVVAKAFAKSSTERAQPTTDKTTIAASKQESAVSTSKSSAAELIKRDLKDSILAKQAAQKLQQQVKPQTPDKTVKVALSLTAATTADGTEMPAFVHDKTNDRFLCTICGYTCEYQRTIKAHIWKHSGNKDIEYPIFQNGPLSIYDESIEEAVKTPEEPKIQPKQKVEVTGISKGTKTGGVSAVAPALAHLLAARAMTGLREKVIKYDFDNKPTDGTDSQPSRTDESMSSSADDNSVEPEIQDTIEVYAERKDMDSGSEEVNNEEEIELEETREDRPGEETENVSQNINQKVLEEKETNRCAEEEAYESMTKKDNDSTNGGSESTNDKMIESVPETSRSTVEKPSSDVRDDEEALFREQGFQQMDVSEEDKSKGILKRIVVPVKQSLATGEKRKLDNSKDVIEMLQMVKRFCAEEKCKEDRVVVEIVNSDPSLSSLTGMASQQGSPRAQTSTGSVEMETETLVSEMDQMTSDSGFLSDSNSKIETSTFDGSNSVKVDESLLRKSKRLKNKVAKHSTTEVDLLMDKEEERVDENLRKDVEPQTTRKRTSSVAESAVTLLSLLKKGPNHNPACPTVPTENTVMATEVDKKKDSKPPSKGISSSLLAVIEQLRERSRSETDTEDPSGSKKVGKKRIKRDSVEDIDSMELIDNVERMEEEEEDEARFRCKLCHYSNSSTFVMKQHMRLHKTKRPFECSLCEFMAESSEDLQNHMIKHCKVRTYQCKLCPSAFNYKSQLRAHMRAHKDIFACEECDFESHNLSIIRNHVSVCHKTKLYVCEICEERYGSKQDLKNHKKYSCKRMNPAVSNTGVFEETHIQETVTNNIPIHIQNVQHLLEEDLKSHESQSPQHKLKTAKEEFMCFRCDYVTNNFSRFNNHTKIHEAPKEPLKCDFCDFPALSNRSLKSHMKRHINDQRFVQQPLEQYKCNLCGYVCHHLPSLKSHMWRHASDTNYSYEFTNEVINAAIDYDSKLDTTECQEEDIEEFNETIREKMRVRLESQGLGKGEIEGAQSARCWVTFRCCQCGFEVINKAQLNLHMRTHSDVIRWTLQVNNANSKESSTSTTKETE